MIHKQTGHCSEDIAGLCEALARNYAIIRQKARLLRAVVFQEVAANVGMVAAFENS